MVLSSASSSSLARLLFAGRLVISMSASMNCHFLLLQPHAQLHARGATSHRPLPKRLVPIIRRNQSSTPPPPPPRKVVLVLGNIQLTEIEEKIFSALKAVLVYFKLKTQLRVAGGWVRDKLLGEEECKDIDVAIDDMLGRTFCKKVYWYLRSIGLETPGFGVIKSNPMQAKHLEVARMQIYGVLIDFVNLRPENYTENSSISFMEDFGTATQDAYRRDLTINSLFYNINTGLVEDPTGRGLSDLKAGIIATPLPAKTTFMDDPLRVLRALRFVAQLDYELHDEIKAAAVDKDIQLALISKISRERIGHEVHRIFLSNQPIKAIRQLVELQLFPIIFSPPVEIEMTMPEGIERLCLHALEAVWKVLKYFGISKLTSEQRRICLLGAFLSPFRSFCYEDNRNKMVPVSSAIIKESLKMRSYDALKVAALHRSAADFSTIRKVFSTMDDSGQTEGARLNDQEDSKLLTYSFAKYRAASLLVREMRDLWRTALLLSSVLEELPVMLDMSDEEKQLEFRRRSDQCIATEAAIVRLRLEEVQRSEVVQRFYPVPDRRTIVENG